MIGHFNDHGKDRELKRMFFAVEGDKLYITTRSPETGEEHVSVQTIRTLNERQLVVADAIAVYGHQYGPRPDSGAATIRQEWMVAQWPPKDEMGFATHFPF